MKIINRACMCIDYLRRLPLLMQLSAIVLSWRLSTSRFAMYRLRRVVLVPIFSILVSANTMAEETVASTVSVEGAAQVQVMPDEVHFTVGVNANELTAAAAYKTVESRMAEVIRILHHLRIDEQNVQAVSLSLTPVIDYKHRNEIIGHKAQRDVYVKVSDIAIYAKALERLSSVEDLSFSGVRLSSSEQAELQLTALKQAYDNAETKARLIAKQSGRQFGQLIEAREQHVNLYPIRPEQFRASAMVTDAGRGATVSSGVITIEAKIHARFSLQ